MSEKISDFIEKEKILNLTDIKRAVFVGDTHGDVDASKFLWKHFRDGVKKGEIALVFLGDYVDRGPRSKENIDFLLSKKKEFPENLILLLGNHDAYDIRRVNPSDFWQSLTDEQYQYYKDLSSLPWIVKIGKLAASHGALPFVSDLDELKDLEGIFEKKNELGKDLPIWISITWGDLNNNISDFRMDPLTGRPQFGEEIFLKYMQKLDLDLLIRGHQPGMQGWSFSNNALTIFTSQTYVDMGLAYERSVAMVDFEKGLKEGVKVFSLSELK